MDTNQIELLRQEIEKKLGRKIISSSDCHYICAEISHWVKCKISFNTIRRFFNLMKTSHQPSLYTLNVLASYCGYSSYDEFCRTKQKENTPGFDMQGSRLLNYLVFLFKNIEVRNNNDATCFSIMQYTINYLEQQTHIIDRFQREIAKIRNGQVFYFEQCVNTDKLNSFYGEGLRYYLHEKRTPESQIFGYSLLCLRSWLNGNTEELMDHYNTVMKFNISTQTPPSVSARYFATQLYHSSVLGLNPERILINARQYFASISSFRDNFTSFHCFETIIAEALVHVGQYEESIYYLDVIYKKMKMSVPTQLTESLLQTIYLLKATSFSQMGKKSKALELLQLVDPVKFYVLSYKYYNALYLILKKANRSGTVHIEQAHELIKLTGFTRLISLYAPVSGSTEIMNHQS